MRTEVEVKQEIARMLQRAKGFKQVENQTDYDIVMGFLCGMCWALGISMSDMKSEIDLFKACAELME